MPQGYLEGFVHITEVLMTENLSEAARTKAKADLSLSKNKLVRRLKDSDNYYSPAAANNLYEDVSLLASAMELEPSSYLSGGRLPALSRSKRECSTGSADMCYYRIKVQLDARNVALHVNNTCSLLPG